MSRKIVFGKDNRVSAAPHGSIYVRNADAARAAAIAEKVARFEAVGAEVPEYLAGLAAEAGEAGDVVVELEADPVTQDAWRLIGEAEDAEPVAVEVEPVDVEAEIAEAEAELAAVEAEEAVVAEVAEVVEDDDDEVEAEVEDVVAEAPKPRGRPRKNAAASE